MTYQEKFKAFLASALKFDSEESRNRSGGAMGASCPAWMCGESMIKPME